MNLMKCCMVTPYPPEKCGIAIYALKLFAKLANCANIVVIASKDGQDESALDNRLRIIRSWKKASPLYLFEIFKGVAEESPHIVHIQHEYLAYGPRKYSILFPALLLFLRLLRRPVILTMHSVVRRSRLTDNFFFVHQTGRRFAAIKRAVMTIFTKSIVNLSDAVIVHNGYMRSTLVQDYGIERDKIVVVPHGVDTSPVVLSNIQAKEKLGLSQKHVLLFFGFVIPGKGLEVLIKSFSRVSHKISNAILVIAGQYHPRLFREFPRYLGTIERLIRDLELGGRVVFQNQFIDDRRLQLYISAADILVFPYTDDSVLGASGALATCADQSKAVIATRIPRFDSELENDINAVLVEPNNESQLVEAILRVSGNTKLKENLQRNLRTYALQRTWEAVSLSTFKLYKTILKVLS